MKTSCVHHLAVVVRDLNAAERFYGDVIGLEEKQRWHKASGALRSIWYSLGENGPFLAVEHGHDAGEAADSKQNTGWHCISLAIEPEHRESWRDRLRAFGHSVIRETEFTLYVRDPEGNLLGLSHYPTGYSAGRSG